MIDMDYAEATRLARCASGMTQEYLAQKMTERGFAWSQATVWGVESGRRNLLWDEGLALVDLIGFSRNSDTQTARDAAAYRRILNVIGLNESAAIAFPTQDKPQPGSGEGLVVIAEAQDASTFLEEVEPDFGRWVRTKRKAKGLSQSDLAQRTGCFRDASSVSRLESGKRIIRLSEAVALYREVAS